MTPTSFFSSHVLIVVHGDVVGFAGAVAAAAAGADVVVVVVVAWVVTIHASCVLCPLWVFGRWLWISSPLLL